MTASLYGERFFAGRSYTVSLSASVVVPIVYGIVKPVSVLDVGCGQGEWLHAFEMEGVQDLFGVDIAAPDGDRFLRYDLTGRLSLGRSFDLAVCLEVGEHLPWHAADLLVETLTSHSYAVLFSAAVVGQEGVGHINCQPHEYWHDKFAAHGYRMSDVVRPRLTDDARVSAWYRNNIFLYTRHL